MEFDRIAYTCDAAGSATVFSDNARTGRVHIVRYLLGDSADPDLTITGEDSGTAILTDASVGAASVTWYPRTVKDKSADGTAGADTNETEMPALFMERIKIVVANGDAGGIGTVLVGYVS